MVKGSPLVNTISAASGSTKMLNYAAGLQLPSPMAPPIIVIPFIFYFISGNAFKMIAKLVMAPVTTNSMQPYCSMILL